MACERLRKLAYEAGVPIRGDEGQPGRRRGHPAPTQLSYRLDERVIEPPGVVAALYEWPPARVSWSREAPTHLGLLVGGDPPRRLVEPLRPLLPGQNLHWVVAESSIGFGNLCAVGSSTEQGEVGRGRRVARIRVGSASCGIPM